jgi:hypothetical protein
MFGFCDSSLPLFSLNALYREEGKRERIETNFESQISNFKLQIALTLPIHS